MRLTPTELFVPFDTGSIDPGSSSRLSTLKPGRYPYHCSIHSFMHGTLVVS